MVKEEGISLDLNSQVIDWKSTLLSYCCKNKTKDGQKPNTSFTTHKV